MRLIITALLFSFSVASFSQTFQATLKDANDGNKLVIAIKPNAVFSSRATNLQFTVAIPTSVGARPVLTVESNYYSQYITDIAVVQTATYLTDYVYLINMTSVTATAASYTAGEESNVLLISLSGNVNSGTNVRLMQLPNGEATAGFGPENGNYNNYIEYLGIDRTNTAEMFYASPGGTVINNPLGYAGFSFVSRGADPMPLTWIDFNAARTNMHGSLTWQVANQLNNNHFEIEVSKDGRSFNYLAKVPATSSNFYQYTHEFIDRWNVPSLYYRIKQVDKDGAFSYSTTKKLQLNGKALSLTLGQNPIKGSDVRAFIHATDAGKGTLMVTDLSGKVLYQKQTSWSGGTNNHTINMSAFASGGYILSLITDEEKVQVKFVK